MCVLSVDRSTLGGVNSAFIGRDHPAGVLRGEVDRVRDSHGGLVLVTGEAGIGKTTLVTTAADEARRQGTLVLSGSCWDSDSVPGLWPWVQVVRALRRAATEDEWARAEEAAGDALPVLLGERPGETSGEFPLFDAVTSALVAVSQSRPVMVVLDDLHWADAASVRLLAFAAQHAWFERLLLVGTYRDVDIEGTGHPLEPLLLSLVSKATTLTLTGLTVDEVGDLITLTGVDRPAPELVAEVHRRTGGNPFFVEQTARLWHGTQTGAVPPGVRDAVRRRLEALSDDTHRLLAWAAVLGREFDAALLAAATGRADVERRLNRAIAARLIAPVGPGRYGFVHDLVRETLEDDQDRRAAHAAVARALDDDPVLAATVFPADRARHAHGGVPDYPAERAVDLLAAAARDAMSRLSTEESAAHLRRAIPLAAPERRVALLVQLGESYIHGNEVERAWAHLREAAEIARGLDSARPLARVAVTLHRHGPPRESRLTDEVVREAHRRIYGREETDTTSPLETVFRELVFQATAIARSGADEESLSVGLWAQHDMVLGLGSAAERVRLTGELTDLARAAGDRDMEWFAASMRWVALLELGDPAYLDQFRDTAALTDHSPRNQLSSRIDHTIIDTLAGRFARAGELLDGFTEDDLPDCHNMIAYMRWVWLLRQGRHGEAGAVLGEPMAGFEHPDLLAAITAAEQGRTEAALRYVRATVPRADTLFGGHLRPLWLRALAQTAALARDTELIKLARKELADHSGSWLVALYGFDVSGPVDLWLGVLDLAERRWDDAIAHLTAAADSAEAMDARPWAVDARAWLVKAYAGRGEDTTALSAQIAADAERLGMTQHSAAEPDVPQFRREGPVWSLAFGGTHVHMPDTKGLRDLHALLANPGTDIPAAHLLDPQATAAVRTVGADDMLDERAKAEYRRRLDRLDAEIDHHTALGDDARAAALDRERAALLDHLRLAAGLSGRTRRLGDEAERARKAVTARIRDTLRKLDERHPPLAAHLRAAVTTGTTCRYDGRLPWQLR
ncbi:ATP-binding protein [Actinokineospora fastidiosa]|uniref:ATP-binding protein n=1 Tax=Actinokineospora fastidiosa TaxID=1816 RepID=UPI00166F9B7A|nr:AAA family ATPase [Actinokineospora fastidiosa]